MTTAVRNVVPVDRCLHEDDNRRFRHADLGELSESQLWAERVIVDNELARLIFNRVRPRFLDSQQTDQSWLAARSGRLKDEITRRRDGRGRRHAAAPAGRSLKGAA